MQARRRENNVSDQFFVSRQAAYELPLIHLKDHVDFMVGYLEGLLPESERPYHPQEPDRDPFYEIKNKFRYEWVSKFPCEIPILIPYGISREFSYENYDT